MDFSKLPAILTPDLGLLFWMLVAFLVIFILLAKYGFPAILNMVDERNRYIDDSLRKAHEAETRETGSDTEGGRRVARRHCRAGSAKGKG